MIKICHVSDTHLRPWDDKIEEADLLIHSGDALNYGTLSEVISFAQQLRLVKDKFQKIIYVPGNHDWAFDGPNRAEAISILQDHAPNIEVLIHDSCVFNNIKIFGTAYQPEFCNWAFNKSDEDLIEIYSQIPNDTEILITHNPPLAILDHVINRYNPKGYHCGSRVLSDRIEQLKQLKANFFGHIHYSHGTKLINGVHYSNAAICDEMYQPFNSAQIVEL